MPPPKSPSTPSAARSSSWQSLLRGTLLPSVAVVFVTFRIFHQLSGMNADMYTPVSASSSSILQSTNENVGTDTTITAKERNESNSFTADASAKQSTKSSAAKSSPRREKELEQIRQRVLQTQQIIDGEAEIDLHMALKQKSNDHSTTTTAVAQNPHTYKYPMPYPHPFAGALDEQEQWGYVHDARVLQKQNIVATIALSDPDKIHVCEPKVVHAEKDNLLTEEGLKVLEKIRVLPLPTDQKRPRIFCAIYAHEKSAAKIKAITETWGSRCDGFFVASTYTNRETGEVHLPHAGKEGTYNSIWQKVRSMAVYIYTNYGDGYDYFHFCGDDTYIVMENLIHFLQTNPQVQEANDNGKPVSVGGFISAHKQLYNDGGPGYTLNRHALEYFIQTGLTDCYQNVDGLWEDMLMGNCIGKQGLVSTQEQGSNRMRSYHWGPNDVLNNGALLPRVHQKFYFRQRTWRRIDLKEPKDPLDSVSDTTIAFHWIKSPNQMRQIDHFFYPNNSPISDYCGQSQ